MLCCGNSSARRGKIAPQYEKHKYEIKHLERTNENATKTSRRQGRQTTRGHEGKRMTARAQHRTHTETSNTARA